MDGEGRIGPLSYDVSAADAGIDPDRPIILGGVTAVGLLLLSLVGGWFALGWITNSQVVTRGFPLAIVVVPLLVTGWLGRRLRARPRRNSLLVVLGAALLCAVLANRSLGTIKPALPQVRESIASVHLPAGFRLVAEETRGDRMCHHGCPTVVRRYAAPETDPDPVSTMVLAMFAQGWEPTSDVEPSQATTAQRGDINAQLGEKSPHVVEITVQRDA
jgi:hypothetical protein